MKKTNNEKTNVTINTVFDNYEKLYNALIECETKHQLVDVMNMFGLRTTTQPTDTKNKNDLYIQFNDKSRVLIGKRMIKLYTCDEIANDKYFDGLTFDVVNDGSYRTKRCSIANNVENFKKFFSYFLNDNANYLPTMK
jgi:hypothetical protein